MSEKPKWETAPEWAEYLAKDENGAWYWFENAPKVGSNGNWLCAIGCCEEAKCNDDWWQTLEPRP